MLQHSVFLLTFVPNCVPAACVSNGRGALWWYIRPPSKPETRQLLTTTNKLKNKLMKQKLLNLLLLTVALVAGSSGAWAKTGTTVGNTDFTSGWWEAFSPYYTFKAEQKLHLEFTNHTCDNDLCVTNGWGDPAGWKNFYNFILVITNDVDRGGDGYKEYVVLRPDNYGWGDKYDGTKNSSNWNWDNFQAIMNGANVTLEVIRKGSNVDVKMNFVGGDENNYYQNFSFDSGDAENNFRAYLSVEHAYINIDDSKTAVVGGTATLPIAGHIQVSGTGVYEGMSLTKTYINSYAKNGGAFAFKFMLDEGFDPTLIKSAKLNMHINGKPNKNRTSTVSFRPQTSDPTPTSNINDTKTSIDTNAKVVSYGGNNTKRWVWSNSPTVTDSWSSYTNSYPQNGTTITVDVTKLVKSFTTKNPGEEIWISADVNDVAADIYVDGYGSDNPPTLVIEYSNEPLAAYTVNAKCGDLILGELAADSYVVGMECTVEGLSKAIMKDGKCYVLDQTQTGINGYNYTFTKAADDETLYINYALNEDMVYFGEVEKLGNATGAVDGNYSGGKYAAIAGNKKGLLTTMKPGKYTLTGYLAERGDRGIYLRNDGNADNTTNTIAYCDINKNSAVGEYSVPFTLTEPTAVSLSGYTSGSGTNQSSGIDYVYITRTGNAALPGYFGKVAELTGDVNEDYNITISGNTLTVKSLKEGYGIQNIKLLTSKLGTITANTGSITSKNIWTGDANEVVLTLDGTLLNSIAVNDGVIPEGNGVNTIQAFKTTLNTSFLQASNTDIRAITDEGIVIEDDNAGILLKNIEIEGAAAGKKLNGKIGGKYDTDTKTLISNELTDCTVPTVATGSPRSAIEMSVVQALSNNNSFRLAKLKGLTLIQVENTFLVTQTGGSSIKLSDKLFSGMGELLDGESNLISLTGIIYFNGTENVLMPRSASDMEKGSVEQSFAEDAEFEAGSAVASNTGIILTFGDEQNDDTYKFETLKEAVNGYTTAATGASYQFDALRDGLLGITVGLDKGKKLSVTCDGKELSLENGDYEFNGTAIALPVETAKTYVISATGSELALMGFSFQVANASAPAVAKNIGVFRKMVDGTEAQLTLKDAYVTYIKGDNVYVEDESGAINLQKTLIQFHKNQKLAGYIEGALNAGYVPALVRTSATNFRTFKATSDSIESTTVNLEFAQKSANTERFVKLENLMMERGQYGYALVVDTLTGNAIRVRDNFNVIYELNDTVKSIEGIIGADAEGIPYIWPTSKEGVVSVKTYVAPEVDPYADVDVYYRNDYEDGGLDGWSTSVGGRFDPTILSDPETENHFLSVAQANTNNNGCVVTGTVLKDAVAADQDFAMTFDMRVASSNNQEPLSVEFKDAAGTGVIFSMVANGKSTEEWKVNGSADNIVTLLNSKPTGDINVVNWYSYRVVRKDNITYVTIKEKETGEVVMEDKVVESSTGALGNIVLTTRRYYGNFAIDNVIVRSLMDGDVPDVTPTHYTIKYVDEAGASIKEDLTIGSIAELEVSANAEQMAAIYTDDQKYIYKEGNEPILLSEDASANVITLVYRQAAQWRYYVNATDLNTSERIVRFVSAQAFEGEVITAPYKRYLLNDGKVYVKDATNKEYRTSFTLTQNYQTVNYDYELPEAAIENVVFLEEAEDIETLTVTTVGGMSSRCSNAAGAFAAEAADIVTLTPGTYVLTIAGYASSGKNIEFKAGEQSVLTFEGAGYWAEIKSAEFTVTENTVLTMQGGNSQSGIDYIMLQSTDGGVITAISAVKGANADGDIYDLRGQKVNGTLKPGLYIKNGNKFVVK